MDKNFGMARDEVIKLNHLVENETCQNDRIKDIDSHDDKKGKNGAKKVVKDCYFFIL